ncbi:hypothetical protein V3N99_08940 [Dermatophilaceae bacterium Soc4.6]
MSTPHPADQRDLRPSEAEHGSTVPDDPVPDDPGPAGPERRPGGRHRWWPALVALAAVACCALPGLLSAGVLAGLAGAGAAGLVGLGGGLILLTAAATIGIFALGHRRRHVTTGVCPARGGSGGCAPDEAADDYQ